MMSVMLGECIETGLEQSLFFKIIFIKFSICDSMQILVFLG